MQQGGGERIHITWAYQSADGKQHVIVLKHNTITNMNKESKRIIYVGTKKYDAKQMLQIGISIHKTDSRSFDYSLSINEKPFEELCAQCKSCMSDEKSTTSTTETIATTSSVGVSASTTEDSDNRDSCTDNQNSGNGSGSFIR